MHRPVERWPAVGNVKHGNGSVIPSGFCYLLPRYRYIARTIRTRHMNFMHHIHLKIYMVNIKVTICVISERHVINFIYLSFFDESASKLFPGSLGCRSRCRFNDVTTAVACEDAPWSGEQLYLFHHGPLQELRKSLQRI